MPTCRVCLHDYRALRFKSDRVSICGRCVNSLNKNPEVAQKAEARLGELLIRGIERRAISDLTSSEAWKRKRAQRALENLCAARDEALPSWLNKLLADPKNSTRDFKILRSHRRGLLRYDRPKRGWDYPANWKDVAARIRKLDHFKCVACGASDQVLDVHHIIYVSNLGTHQQTNLVTLCRPCHEAEHKRVFDFGEATNDDDAPPEAATVSDTAAPAFNVTPHVLVNASDGCDKATGGSDTLGSSKMTSRETYVKAKPLFQSAVSHLVDAGTDIKEVMRAVVKMVMAKFGSNVAVNMKPYVVRFFEEYDHAKTDKVSSNDLVPVTFTPAVDNAPACVRPQDGETSTYTTAQSRAVGTGRVIGKLSLSEEAIEAQQSLFENMDSSIKVWAPRTAPGGKQVLLAVNHSWPMTAGQHRLQMAAKLRALLAQASPEEARQAMEMSVEWSPELYQIAKNNNRLHWPEALMESDTMHIALNLIEWEQEGALSLEAQTVLQKALKEQTFASLIESL